MKGKGSAVVVARSSNGQREGRQEADCISQSIFYPLSGVQ